MRDVNYPLRKAYFTALTGIVYNSLPVPCYYQIAPDNIANTDYIIFYPQSTTDISTKNSSDVTATFVVKIHTWANKYNNGNAADAIADIIYQLLLPTPQSTLFLDNRDMYSTSVASDIIEPWTVNNQRIYVDRVITFSHNIYVEGFSSNGTNIIIMGLIQKYNYTATGGENGFTDTILRNRNIALVDKDGIGIEVVSGTPAGKQVQYIPSTGQFVFAIDFEGGEKILIIYQ